MTSIEWLIEQIKLDHIQKALSAAQWMVVVEQAKEMHKQEIMEAVSFGDCRGRITTYLTDEQYYNETFKKD